MQDTHGRKIEYLRISVTDRCNLRCVYCMPAEGIEWYPHEEMLSFEETLRLCRIFASLGVSRIKLTGGEPLVRRGIVSLVRQIKEIPGIEEVTMTTNGMLFAEMGRDLAAAGLDSVTFSLDTLDPERYAAMTRLGKLPQVLEGLRLAVALGLSVKINAVLLRGQNEEELEALASFAKDSPIHVRFIELMPIGCAQDWPGIPNEELQARLDATYGESTPIQKRLGNGPAVYRQYPGFRGAVGFISAMSHPFCHNCNRVRLTSRGELKLCLHQVNGIQLLPLLRDGRSDESIREVIAASIAAKPEQHHFDTPHSREEQQMNAIGG